MFVKRTVGRNFKQCPTGADHHAKETRTTSRAAQPDSSDLPLRIQEIPSLTHNCLKRGSPNQMYSIYLTSVTVPILTVLP
jgi:hypothetical protein